MTPVKPVGDVRPSVTAELIQGLEWLAAMPSAVELIRALKGKNGLSQTRLCNPD